MMAEYRRICAYCLIKQHNLCTIRHSSEYCKCEHERPELKDIVFTEDEIRHMEHELQVAKCSRTVDCRRCKKRLERLWPGATNVKGALSVKVDGSYGEFIHNMDNDPDYNFYLCHDCAHEFFTWATLFKTLPDPQEKSYGHDHPEGDMSER